MIHRNELFTIKIFKKKTDFDIMFIRHYIKIVVKIKI